MVSIHRLQLGRDVASDDVVVEVLQGECVVGLRSHVVWCPVCVDALWKQHLQLRMHDNLDESVGRSKHIVCEELVLMVVVLEGVVPVEVAHLECVCQWAMRV
jgi:hypothetical protein